MLVLFVSTDQATTVTYTLSLHDALPICYVAVSRQKSTVPSTIRIVDWNGRVLADLATTTTSDINRVELTAHEVIVAASDGSVEVIDRSTKSVRWRASTPDQSDAIHVDRRGRLWLLGGHAGAFAF